MNAKTTVRARSSDRYNFTAITIDPRDSLREYSIASCGTHREENIGKHIEDRDISLLLPLPVPWASFPSLTPFGSKLPERGPAVRLFADVRSAGSRAKNLSKTSSTPRWKKGWRVENGRRGGWDFYRIKFFAAFGENRERQSQRADVASLLAFVRTNSGYFDRP